MIQTLLTVIEQIALYLPLMMGAYIAFSLMKMPHLSIESAYVSGAIIASKVLTYNPTTNSMLCLLHVLIASMVGGALSGGIVSVLGLRGKIPYFLANILTIGLCYGINLFILGGSNISLASNANPLIITVPRDHPELIVACIMSAIIFVLMTLFFNTQLGMCFAIYGNNPLFFQNYGISTHFVVSCGFIVVNALAGLSGYLVAQTSGFVDLNMGVGLSLFCITALVLGKVIIRSNYKVLTVLVPIIGLGLYSVLQQVLIKIGFNPKYFTVLQALIVAIVLIVYYRDRISSANDHLGV